MNTYKNNTQLPQSSVKSRFFAQYWGTKTLYIGGVGLVELGNGGWNLKHPDFFLQLKPLSQITDEDLKFIYSDKKINVDIDEDVYLSKKLANFVESDIYLTDYLRSKGYALPFMEYSVDDIVSFGWVQLL